MNPRRAIGLLLIQVALLFTSPAGAGSAVREIPVLVVVVGDSVLGADNFTPVDLTVVEKMVDHTNRAWAASNIRLTWNRNTGWLKVLWPDLNCWSDQETDPTDTALANIFTQLYPDSVVALFISYMDRRPGVSECVPLTCTLPGQGVEDSCVADQGSDVGCESYPWGNYCAAAYYWSSGPSCFAAGCTAVPCDQGTESLQASVFGRHEGGSQIGAFEHEFGHHFGLAHTHDAGRCYDTAKADSWPNCVIGPTDCVGAGYRPWPPFTACGGDDMPWKNVMSYHAECYMRNGGSYHGIPSDWNASLSQEQIAIMWRSLDEYYDRTLLDPDDWPVEPQYGRNDHMFVVKPDNVAPIRPTSAVVGYGTWGDLSFYERGGTNCGETWTKGSIRLVQGDLNGDGDQDAVVSVASGNPCYPGTSFWKGSHTQGGLTFVRYLNPSAFPGNSEVLVADFRGDTADDVLIRTTTEATEWEGMLSGGASDPGGPTAASTVHSDWYLGGPRVVLGDFEGLYEQPTPLTSSAAANLTAYSNQSYVDALVLFSAGTYLYPGTRYGFSGRTYESGLHLAPHPAWAANVWGDSHDELIVRGTAGLEVFKGVPSGFSMSAVDRIFHRPELILNSTLELAIGNFSGDYMADFITVASAASGYNGSYLWCGSWSAGPVRGPFDWSRSDLVPGYTRYAVADLVRGSFDDLMISTSSGSFLYAGKPRSSQAPFFQATFSPNAWSSYAAEFILANAAWFGR